MQKPVWLLRVIEYFSNETEECVGEVELPQVDLVKLQRLWGLPCDEPMVECFQIQEQQAPFFRELVDFQFDFDSYSYFLSAYTTDWQASKRDGGYMGMYPPPRTLPGFPDARAVIPKDRHEPS